MQRVVFASLVVIVVAGSFRLSGAAETVNVDGGQVTGVETDGVRTFKGIPFAAPPVGDLRWKPPQPVVPWTGVRKADAYGPQCVQLPFPAASPYKSDPATMSEDCLHLNVWTGPGANEKRPVMVWIYGGAWTRGAASAASGGAFVYDGAALAKKGVVVVTPNYRLGSGARFELASTFFSPALLTPTLRQAEQSGVALATALGANSLEELRAAPADTLVAVTSFPSSINVDGWVLPADIRTIFAEKRHIGVPVLVGSNANEWTTLSNPATFPKTMEDLASASTGSFLVWRMNSMLRMRSGAKRTSPMRCFRSRGTTSLRLKCERGRAW
jgi:carboxylesterase type B